MDKLIELFMASGPSVLLLAACIFWGKNLIEYFFKETVELKKQELNQEFEKFKLTIKNQEDDYRHRLEMEKNYTLNKYQIENIKVNRVLPIVEEFSENIKLKRVLFGTYLNVLLNKGNPENYENKRIEIHTKLLELSGKVDIYIPFELKKIMDRLILLVSNSFHDGNEFDSNFLQVYQIENKEVLFHDCLSYLKIYWEAYYEMISLYIQEFSIKSKGDERIVAILGKHKINPETYDIIHDTIDIQKIENLVLLSDLRH
jgi:hypothetical protein